MVISVEEMKNYLRVDTSDDDGLISELIGSATDICLSISRMEDLGKFQEEPTARIAVMYAAAYLYEHREEADHHQLELSLRSLLSGIRKGAF